ncbi:MAG: hypothetical protein PHF56_11640 [Desulfuromonadaceae bacterium]|nr:hypothetical protein [Desulfuromonadaceae bacterium]
MSHYLEEEGLATTQISLVREHTEHIKPPRALWVPFGLGRPFGPPNDASFQTRVVVSALKLLEAAEGPVLVDFPDDEPESASQNTPVVCPVNFASAIAEMTTIDLVLEAFKSEAANMNGWYEIALSIRGRTTAGVSCLSLNEIVGFFASFISGARDTCPITGVTIASGIRMAAEDLKAIYCEGLTAQPGEVGDSTAIANWFWGETVAAQVINAIREICLGLPANDFQLLGKLLLVPRNQLHRFQ